MAWYNIFSSIVKPITGAYKVNQDRKAAKTAGLQAIESQIIAGETTIQMSKQQWQAMSLKGNESSWKDELITVVFMIPIVTIMFGGVYGGVTGNTAVIEGMVKAIQVLNSIGGNFGTMMTAVVYAGIGLQVTSKFLKK